MEFVPTADKRFDNLEGYPFEPHYLAVPDGESGELRVPYVAEGELRINTAITLKHRSASLFQGPIPRPPSGLRIGAFGGLVES